MGVPATTGVLRTNIADMEIGDYVARTVAGDVVADPSTYTEVPLTGEAWSVGDNGKIYYMVKVAKGLLIADRVYRHTVSWDTLNGGKHIQGQPKILSGINGTQRSVTGGVAYADANGNKSMTGLGLGAWPTNNEWDKYIVNFPTELIESGKTLDDVFHWSGVHTWVQETPVNGMPAGTGTTANTFRCKRGNASAVALDVGSLSTASATSVGFRPVFEYTEPE